MAVIIEEMHSTVEAEPGTGTARAADAGAPSEAAGAAGAPLDEEALRGRFRPVLREIIREELERYLRGAAD